MNCDDHLHSKSLCTAEITPCRRIVNTCRSIAVYQPTESPAQVPAICHASAQSDPSEGATIYTPTASSLLPMMPRYAAKGMPKLRSSALAAMLTKSKLPKCPSGNLGTIAFRVEYHNNDLLAMKGTAERSVVVKPFTRLSPSWLLAETPDQRPVILDSGCSMHITGYGDWLENMRPSTGHSIRGVGGHVLPVTAFGDLSLICMSSDNRERLVTINQIMLVPGSECTLLSTAKLIDAGLSIHLHSRGATIKDASGAEIACCKRSVNLCVLRYRRVPPQHLSGAFISEAGCSAAAKSLPLHLWHLRMGHLAPAAIRSLESAVDGMTISDSGDNVTGNCAGCLVSNATRHPFHASESMAHRPLQLIHADIAGPFRTKTASGAQYYLAILDDYSRLVTVHLLQHKSDAFSLLVQTLRQFETQLETKVQMLRTDGGSEFCSNTALAHYAAAGIVHQKVAAFSPEANGRIERVNLTLMRRVRAMLHSGGFPKHFWGEALYTAAMLQNVSPHRALPKEHTPFSRLHATRPDLSGLRPFGCLAFVQIPQHQRGKLDRQALVCKMLGYETQSRAYRLYDVEHSCVIISRNVRFIETRFPHLTPLRAALRMNAIQGLELSDSVGPDLRAQRPSDALEEESALPNAPAVDRSRDQEPIPIQSESGDVNINP